MKRKELKCTIYRVFVLHFGAVVISTGAGTRRELLGFRNRIVKNIDACHCSSKYRGSMHEVIQPLKFYFI